MIIKRISGRNNVNLIKVYCDKCGNEEIFRFKKGFVFEKENFEKQSEQNKEKNEEIKKEKKFIIW
ncbi:MAG: hypothetical protein QXO40_04100 [Candidatus Aenigmatarchaeota archaeon]